MYLFYNQLIFDFEEGIFTFFKSTLKIDKWHLYSNMSMEY
jgi:hypothetical protein